MKITKRNLPDAVDAYLEFCKSERDKVKGDVKNYALFRDLDIAVAALQSIANEIHGPHRRPKGQRAGGFIRYVLDEEEQMEMDAGLRNAIRLIEDLYDRW